MWISPSGGARIRYRGEERVAAIAPDPTCTVNRGNHSMRGGTLGAGLTTADGSGDATRERFTTPLIRLRSAAEADGTGLDEWAPLDWSETVDLVADLIQQATGHLADPSRLGVRMYDYHSLEATYAATRLFFHQIKTPNVAFHDRPGAVDSMAGLSDAGIHGHAFSFDDLLDCDDVLLLGNNPYETQSTLFKQAMAGRRLVVLDPRETMTANYAVRTGGIHLRPRRPGMDACILNAISRLVLRQYQDILPVALAVLDFMTADHGRFDAKFSQDPTRRRAATRHLGLAALRAELDAPRFDAATVEAETGISVADLSAVARILADPTRRAAVVFDKGLLWGFNYQNTAAVANLAIVTFNFNAPNRAHDPPTDYADILRPIDAFKRGFCGCLGGHQKGWAQAAPYPLEKSADTFRSDEDEYPIPQYLDFHLVGRDDDGPSGPRDVFEIEENPAGRWTPAAPPTPVIAHHLRDGRPTAAEVMLYWIVGGNPAGQMLNAAEKSRKLQRRISGRGSYANGAQARDALRQRAADGQSLIVIQQDIYPSYSTQFADLILPCRAWGEEPVTRSNAERRLRLYDAFQDPPFHSSCLADWEIFTQVGRKLPDPPPDWATSADVFDTLARQPDVLGDDGDLRPLMNFADARGVSGHEALRARGNRGWQWPLRFEEGDLAETATWMQRRDPDLSARPGQFGPFFVQTRWDDVRARAQVGLGNDEVWICSGRINELYATLFASLRNEFVRDRWPADLPGAVVEVNARQGFDNGDLVRILAADEPVVAPPAGATYRSPFDRSLLAVVSVQASVPDHMAFVVMAWPCTKPAARPTGCFQRAFNDNGFVNNLTGTYVDPATGTASYKLARGRIERVAAAVRPLPTNAPRHWAFPNGQAPPHAAQPVAWAAREALVAFGLPGVPIVAREDDGQVCLDNATHGAFWRTSHGTLQAFVQEPVLNQFALADAVRPERSTLLRTLRFEAGLPPMPMGAIPMPELMIARIEAWIRGKCREEGFDDVLWLLDWSVRPHARLAVQPGRHEARDAREWRLGIPIESVMRDPDWGVDYLRSRPKWLSLFTPNGRMTWRGPDGGVLTAWTPAQYALLAAWMGTVPPAAPAPPVTFADVQRILDGLGDLIRPMHGRFWMYLTKEEFVNHRVPFGGGQVAIVHKGNGAASPLVQSLRGTGPFVHFKMPLPSWPSLDPADIQTIESWIDHGCP